MKKLVVLEVHVRVDCEKLAAAAPSERGGSVARVIADEVSSNLESVGYVDEVVVREVKTS